MLTEIYKTSGSDEGFFVYESLAILIKEYFPEKYLFTLISMEICFGMA